MANDEQWDQASIECVRLIAQVKDDRRWFSPLKKVCRDLAQWPEVFQRVSKLQPDETTLWIGRGKHHALRSRWKQSASDYQQGFSSRSFADETIFEYAGALLLIDDQHGYERLCTQLAESLVGDHDSSSAFTAARTCSLGPAKMLEPEQAVEWAARRLQEFTEPWDLHVMGLAQYRAGQYVDAIETLLASNDGDWGGDQGAADALNWIVLSMCHHKLGDPDRANECYEKANNLIKQATPPQGEATSLACPDWIEWHVLLRQAEKLIDRGEETTESPVSADPP